MLMAKEAPAAHILPDLRDVIDARPGETCGETGAK